MIRVTSRTSVTYYWCRFQLPHVSMAVVGIWPNLEVYPNSTRGVWLPKFWSSKVIAYFAQPTRGPRIRQFHWVFIFSFIIHHHCELNLISNLWQYETIFASRFNKNQQTKIFSKGISQTGINQTCTYLIKNSNGRDTRSGYIRMWNRSTACSFEKKRKGSQEDKILLKSFVSTCFQCFHICLKLSQQ